MFIDTRVLKNIHVIYTECTLTHQARRSIPTADHVIASLSEPNTVGNTVNMDLLHLEAAGSLSGFAGVFVLNLEARFPRGAGGGRGEGGVDEFDRCRSLLSVLIAQSEPLTLQVRER